MGATAVDKELDFASCLKGTLALTRADRMIALAQEVGASFDFQNSPLNAPRGESEDVLAICNAMSAKTLNAALREAFDAEDYFNGIPKELCCRAVREAMGEDHAAKVAKMTKGDAVKFCVANLPGAKWLPEQLRTGNYDGPADAPKKAAPAKRKAKEKRR